MRYSLPAVLLGGTDTIRRQLFCSLFENSLSVWRARASGSRSNTPVAPPAAAIFIKSRRLFSWFFVAPFSRRELRPVPFGQRALPERRLGLRSYLLHRAPPIGFNRPHQLREWRPNGAPCLAFLTKQISGISRPKQCVGSKVRMSASGYKRTFSLPPVHVSRQPNGASPVSKRQSGITRGAQ